METIADLIGIALAMFVVTLIRELATLPRRRKTNQRIEAAEKQAKDASTESENNAKSIRLLTERNRDLVNELDARDAKIAAVTELAQKAERQAQNAETRAKQKDAEVDELRAELAELRQSVENITRERNERAEELLRERKRAEALEQRVKALESENHAHQLEIVTLRAELNAYKSIIEPFFKQLTLVVGAVDKTPTPPKQVEDGEAAA